MFYTLRKRFRVYKFFTLTFELSDFFYRRILISKNKGLIHAFFSVICVISNIHWSLKFDLENRKKNSKLEPLYYSVNHSSNILKNRIKFK